MSATGKPLTAPQWTDEQAADAVLAFLPPPQEITFMRTWFRPKPKGDETAGPSEWVSRAEHASIMLTLGRAILGLRSRLEQAQRRNEELIGKVYAADSNAEGYATKLEQAQRELAAKEDARQQAVTLHGELATQYGQALGRILELSKQLGEAAKEQSQYSVFHASGDDFYNNKCFGVRFRDWTYTKIPGWTEAEAQAVADKFNRYLGLADLLTAERERDAARKDAAALREALRNAHILVAGHDGLANTEALGNFMRGLLNLLCAALSTPPEPGGEK